MGFDVCQLHAHAPRLSHAILLSTSHLHLNTPMCNASRYCAIGNAVRYTSAGMPTCFWDSTIWRLSFSFRI